MDRKTKLIYADDLLSSLRDDETIDGAHFKRVKQHINAAPAVDAESVKRGRWVLTAKEEYSNYRFTVAAECSECYHSKGEIWAGFFPVFPKQVAIDIALTCAERVKLDNYCPNCGAKMDGGNEDGAL